MQTLLIYLFLLLMYPGKRQVLIFYNPNGELLKNKQLNLLNKDKSGLEERSIIIQTFQLEAAQAEIKKWHIDASKAFTIILVGKDGGEKLRADSVVNNTQLFSTIDAMPMRKKEMQKDE